MTAASPARDTLPFPLAMNSQGVDPLFATLYTYAVRYPVQPPPTNNAYGPVVHADGSVALMSATHFLRRGGYANWGPNDVMWALQARGAAAGRLSTPHHIDWFASRVLCLRTGKRWHEAVSTALMSDWTAPLENNGRITLDAIQALRAEARTIHKQLVPLWQRGPRSSGSRMLLLDTPLGADLTLYDLVRGYPNVQDLALGACPDDPRIVRVLAQLRPEEKRVALMWAHSSVSSWAEAAFLAGASDPLAFGRHVYRKLKRLGARHTARAQAARQSAPGQQRTIRRRTAL
ncbi:predicted protein [Streptomyces viridochromogenes DSM 40736]|uniref:Predicted protein n=1 Tax=Streptomyces viridochromogenes (strain DSM 40736 / JCM 4977 / BCRC 1201 / Tue 494) TaxID=591159 RepID=D9XI07_STRVT|nr:hypothetical protein [Streptomyces viridochromogenes]EFL37186.1 predicted protein [Streptomyces viridochromogenes DSM 40736]